MQKKEILSKYVGWGGIPQAFDKNNESWSTEYTQLKELLTHQEYRQANASVLDAFYTSPAVIDGIYEALENFGFQGGNVLEPAMGVGNFFGRMPEEMQKILGFMVSRSTAYPAESPRNSTPMLTLQYKDLKKQFSKWML